MRQEMIAYCVHQVITHLMRELVKNVQLAHIRVCPVRSPAQSVDAVEKLLLIILDVNCVMKDTILIPMALANVALYTPFPLKLVLVFAISAYQELKPVAIKLDVIFAKLDTIQMAIHHV